MTTNHQPNYDKILSPLADIRTSIEALLEGAFGALMGDQRESLKRIYTSSWGLHALFMDIITSLGIENIARRSYLGEKFDAVVEPIIDNSQSLLGQMDGPLTEEQRVSVEFILETGNLLKNYVDTLWLYSRVLHQTLPMKIQSIQIEDAVKPDSLPVTALDDVALEYLLPDSLPPIKGDASSLNVALHQIIQNALEATVHGYVRVKVFHKGGVIQIEIEDSGAGIAPYHRDHVFDAFYQGDKSKIGMGLGLTIARSILHQQNGDLKIQHTGQHGSQFICTLPIA